MARHLQGRVRHERVTNPSHFKGLIRAEPVVTAVDEGTPKSEQASSLTAFGRDLSYYADVMEARP